MASVFTQPGSIAAFRFDRQSPNWKTAHVQVSRTPGRVSQVMEKGSGPVLNEFTARSAGARSEPGLGTLLAFARPGSPAGCSRTPSNSLRRTHDGQGRIGRKKH